MNIQELEDFFKTVELPATVTLHQGIYISNVNAFVESHLNILKAYPPDTTVSKPFYERLMLLKEVLSKDEAGIIE